MWLLVIGRYATLQEIETHWSLDDLIKASLALAVQSKIDSDQLKEIKSRGGRS